MRLRALGSLKLTLPLMAALLAAVVGTYRFGLVSIWWTVAPTLLLTLNLAAAIIANPRFRRQAGLLVFHVALLSLLLFAAYGQLASLTGRVEIAQGQAFSPELVMVQSRGPWHDLSRLEGIHFIQGSLQVDYAPQLLRGGTRSTVYRDEDVATAVVVGDNVPLTQHGYRFYTTPNKGLAAVLVVQQRVGGAAQLGTVHFPSYPLRDWDQQVSWTVPGGTPLQLTLEIDRRPDLSGHWTLDDSLLRGARLALQGADGERQLLVPGDTAKVGEQVVKLEALRLWLGYEVFYNPALSWMLAAALVAVLGLGWHFWAKLWSKPLSTEPVQVKHRSGRWVHT
jgi:cytochrome c biogenesis protein